MGIFYVLYSTLPHLPPLRFHCVFDAGIEIIEPRTVATLTLSLTTQLDLIHTRLDLIHAQDAVETFYIEQIGSKQIMPKEH